MQQYGKTASTAGYAPGPAWNATSITAASMPAPASGLLPAGPACQPCPECGGLQCLCRPRFFAGQLLTEQDLNRLEQYVIAKNQLHNRYLVGEGVAGGLEVTCSPCANTVTVSSGYAIDTCGNDIIVCSPDTVDICKLINSCTPTTAINCAPYKDGTTCQDLEQEWILAIRYQEVPSRGMTALTGSSQCNCGTCASTGCSCGGTAKTAGGCCGQTVNNSAPQVTPSLPRRGAPPTCEPTVTCEAYRYEVFPAPPTAAVRNPVYGRGVEGVASALGGDLFARFTCCVQALTANMPALPTTPVTDQTTWSAYCCNLRQALIQYVISNGTTDCQALAKLQAVVCPAPTLDPASFVMALAQAFETEIEIAFEILIGCFCSAALPPCLPPGDPRVPLACVRVRASDCAILSVCNWTPLRKHVVTVKTLSYWLGWLPYSGMIRQFMQQACCAIFNLSDQLGQFAPQTFGAAAAERGAAAEGSQGLNTPISFATQTYQASNSISEAIVRNLASGTQPLNVGDLAQAMSTPIDPTMPADRLAALPHAKIMAEIARPLMNSFGPLVSAAIGGLGIQPGGDGTAAMTAMRAELDELRATVTAQQGALDALRTPPATPTA
jgi:hypothetical protein